VHTGGEHDDRMTSAVLGRFTDFMRAHWTRGEPGRDGMPQRTVVFVYRLWLAALLLKVLGSTWDVSWHFKWQRDNFAWPHDVNLLGDALAVAIVVFHSYTGFGVDKAGLRLMQWGMAVFIIAAPIDALNHAINGLDITSWSASHFLLYIGTAIVIAGVIRGATTALAPGRFRTLMLYAGFAFFFENTLFPNEQQEYGIFELRSWLAGTPEAEPSLLAFAARQIKRPVDTFAVNHFALPVPPWLYPVYGVVAGALVLVVARHLVPVRAAATAVVAGYVGYRSVMWLVLTGGGFPRSAVPFWLLAVGVGVDVAMLVRGPLAVRVLAGSALVTALGYGALAAQEYALILPPVRYWSAPIAFALLAVCWLAGERRLGHRELTTKSGAPIAAPPIT
jgi:hypothetical protein